MEKERSAHQIDAPLRSVEGSFAVAYINLDDPSDTLFINADTHFHAASTMKVPVMIEVFAQAAEGRFSLNDSVELRNEFRSIVDSSLYSLDIADDSGEELYRHLGEQRTVYQLTYDMITYSSNLATNLLIDKVGAHNANRRMHSLGARNIKVLRGVEDQKAFDKGLNNSTTARDLAIILQKLAQSEILTPPVCAQMMDIMFEQKFREIIPAGLPAGVRVAHKTGSITGVRHDAGIVVAPGGPRYVLVLLSKEMPDPEAGVEAMSEVSRLVYQYAAAKAQR